MSGLMSAGMLVLGLVLVIFAVFAPAVLGGGGIEAATGPRLGRVLLPLLVGAAGEVARRIRARWSDRLRTAVGAAVIVLSLVSLWWGWWWV